MVTLGCTLGFPGMVYEDVSPATIVWVVKSTPSNVAPEAVAYTVKHGVTVVASGILTTKGLYQPNFSNVQSRMPGNRTGMATVYGYGIDLDLTILPYGDLVIEAIAQGRDGSVLNLETVTIYNKMGSGAGFPVAPPVVYVHAQNGSDSNSGLTPANPVRTINRAKIVAKALAGSSNIGEATFYCEGDFVGGDGGSSAGSWETGPLRWLNLVAVNGATWRRVNPPELTLSSSTGDFIVAASPNANGYCRVHFKGFNFLGGGPALNDSRSDNTTNIEVWIEGGRWGSVNWDGNGARVRCLEDGSECVDIQGSLPNPEVTNYAEYRKGRTYITGQLRQGCGIGYRSAHLTFDCEVQGNIGGAIYVSGWPFLHKTVYHSITSHDRSYARNQTRGFGANRGNVTADYETLVATDLGGGVTRITGPVGATYDFGTVLADNIGATRTRVGIFDWPGLGDPSSGAGFGGTSYPILAAGVDGSNRPYVDIAATGTTGTGPVGANLETVALVNGSWQRFNDYVHPSFLSRDDGANRGAVIFRDIANYDMTQEVQSHFSNLEGPITELLIDNVRDSGAGANWSMSDESYINCLFSSISAVASTAVLSSGGTYTGSSMVNCVFGNGASLVNAIAGGMTIDHCHFVSNAPAGATNSSTGTWLETDATSDPWHMEPTSGNQGTGSSLVAEPSQWAFSGSGSTKGALRNIALLDNDAEPTSTIDASGAIASGGWSVSAPQGSAETARMGEGALPSITGFVTAPNGRASTSVEAAGALPSLAGFVTAPNGRGTVEIPIVVLPRPASTQGGSNNGSMRSKDPGPHVPYQFIVKKPADQRAWGSGKKPPPTKKWRMY